MRKDTATDPPGEQETEEHIVSLEQWADQLGLGNKAVLTPKEAAAVLRVSERYLRDCVKNGTVPSVRYGKRLLIPVPMLLRSLLREPQHG